MKRVGFLTIATLLAWPLIAQQQSRGVRPLGTETKAQLRKEIADGMGKTWAVLIANSSYTHWPDLQEEPYKDVELIQGGLEKYIFDRIVVEKDITMEGFRPFFDRLYRDVTDEEVSSLLIYYAGHGDYDEPLDQGFWVPVDATRSAGRVGYVSDDVIRRQVARFSRTLQHVLLISDSCFSGKILRRSDDIEVNPSPADLHNLREDAIKKSALGITSGRAQERVPNRSSFARAIQDVLARNRQPYLRAEDLKFGVSTRVRESVIGQQPQFSAFPDTQHEFGQFVFIRNDLLTEVDEGVAGTAGGRRFPVAEEERTPGDREKTISDRPTHLMRSQPHVSLNETAVNTMLRERDFYAAYRHTFLPSNPDGKGLPNRFAIHEPGPVIYDGATGLTWQRGGLSDAVVFSEARDYVRQLNETAFAGVTGWRLPTLEEAMSLMEPATNEFNLNLDPLFGRNIRWIWTADLVCCESTAPIVWIANFLKRGPHTSGSHLRWHVRAVRSGAISAN